MKSGLDATGHLVRLVRQPSQRRRERRTLQASFGRLRDKSPFRQLAGALGESSALMAENILPVAQVRPPHSARHHQSMVVPKTKLDGVEWLAHPVEQLIHLVADNPPHGISKILLDEPSQIVLLLCAPRSSQQLLPQGRDKFDDISVAGYKSDRIRPPIGGRHGCDGNGGVRDKA